MIFARVWFETLSRSGVRFRLFQALYWSAITAARFFDWLAEKLEALATWADKNAAKYL